MKPQRCVNTPGHDHLLYQAMLKYKPLPPLKRLNELLEIVEIPPEKYGEWSGLIRKISKCRWKAGSVAGCPVPSPTNSNRVNWVVRIDGVAYIAARIIYYMTYGKDPGNIQVDHKDQNWLNNNAWNLRLDVDAGIQNVNRPTQRNNTSGIVGVSWYKASEKWIAKVKVKGKDVHLGYYSCKVKAACAVRDKWIELGWERLGRKLPDLSKIQCACGNCKQIMQN